MATRGWNGSVEVIRNYVVLAMALFLPIGGRFMPPLIALWLICWLADYRWKLKWNNLRQSGMLAISAVFFLVYVASLAITDNKTSGVLQIETKMVFFIFPVLTGLAVWSNMINRKKIQNAFVIGTFLAIVVCFVNAALNMSEEKQMVAQGLLNDTYVNWDFFFASRLSFLMHPSYLAMYATFSMYFLFQRIASNWQTKRKLAFLFVGLNLILMCAVFLLASRLAYITMFLLWAGVAVVYIRRTGSYTRGLIGLAVLLITILIVYKSSDIIASRFDYAIRSFTSSEIDKTSSESSAVRRLVWSVASDEIAQNVLFGVGGGDVEHVLMDRYKQEGMTGAYEHKLNAHSQFLQTFLATGFGGFVVLLAMLLLPLRRAFRKKDTDVIIFIAIIILNILVESMFEIQAGVMFFAFFSALFIVLPAESNPGK
jgi:O-antigen ligase